MKVLVTGARGQLGAELLATAPAGIEILAADRSTLDITDRERVQTFIADTKPALVINAAAYTAVDKAEAEADLAYRVNRDGAAHLAIAAHRHGARLIHLSTDYVFDGTQHVPYRPDDAPNPLNVYGASKLAGEEAVTRHCEGGALIVRTAWVYSGSGSNFVKTMARLLRERPEVRVVCDQFGTPTQARELARALWRFAALKAARGVFHWTDNGVASWYDFAVAVRRLIASASKDCGTVVPIPTRDYPTAARRPAFAVLDKTASWQAVGYGQHWQDTLQTMAGFFAAERGHARVNAPS